MYVFLSKGPLHFRGTKSKMKKNKITWQDKKSSLTKAQKINIENKFKQVKTEPSERQCSKHQRGRKKKVNLQ